MSMFRMALLLGLITLLGCPGSGRRGDDDDDDDDSAGDDDDDATGDDDDATGDDDDATGDDDDATGDDDDATGDDDDATGGGCNIDLSLNTNQTMTCDEVWTENGVGLMFRAGTCGSGSCSAETGSKGTWIYPAELYGGFGTLDCTVNEVSITFNDYVGTGAVDAVFYGASGNIIASDTNTMVGSNETVTLTAQGAVAFGISGCETVVVGVQIR